jgi:hypothetical protein
MPIPSDPYLQKIYFETSNDNTILQNLVEELSKPHCDLVLEKSIEKILFDKNSKSFDVFLLRLARDPELISKIIERYHSDPDSDNFIRYNLSFNKISADNKDVFQRLKNSDDRNIIRKFITDNGKDRNIFDKILAAFKNNEMSKAFLNALLEYILKDYLPVHLRLEALCLSKLIKEQSGYHFDETELNSIQYVSNQSWAISEIFRLCLENINQFDLDVFCLLIKTADIEELLHWNEFPPDGEIKLSPETYNIFFYNQVNFLINWFEKFETNCYGFNVATGIIVEGDLDLFLSKIINYNVKRYMPTGPHNPLLSSKLESLKLFENSNNLKIRNAFYQSMPPIYETEIIRFYQKDKLEFLKSYSKNIFLYFNYSQSELRYFIDFVIKPIQGNAKIPIDQSVIPIFKDIMTLVLDTMRKSQMTNIEHKFNDYDGYRGTEIGDLISDAELRDIQSLLSNKSVTFSKRGW